MGGEEWEEREGGAGWRERDGGRGRGIGGGEGERRRRGEERRGGERWEGEREGKVGVVNVHVLHGIHYQQQLSVLLPVGGVT